MECPRCNKQYTEYPALSRRDNQTDICSKCGQDEAMNDFMDLSSIPFADLYAEYVFQNKISSNHYKKWLEWKNTQ